MASLQGTKVEETLIITQEIHPLPRGGTQSIYNILILIYHFNHRTLDYFSCKTSLVATALPPFVINYTFHLLLAYVRWRLESEQFANISGAWCLCKDCDRPLQLFFLSLEAPWCKVVIYSVKMILLEFLSLILTLQVKNGHYCSALQFLYITEQWNSVSRFMKYIFG